MSRYCQQFTFVVFLLTTLCLLPSSQAQSIQADLSDIEQQIHRDSRAALSSLYTLEIELVSAPQKEKLRWIILSIYAATVHSNWQAIHYAVEKSSSLLNKKDANEQLWQQLFKLILSAEQGQYAYILNQLQQLEPAIEQQKNSLLSAYFNRQLHFAYAMNGALDFALDTALSNYKEWLQLEQYYFSIEMLYRIAELRLTVGDVEGANIALKQASEDAERLEATNMQIAIIELEAQILQHKAEPKLAYEKLNQLLINNVIDTTHDRYESVMENMMSFSFELKQFQQSVSLGLLLLAQQIKENKNISHTELLLAKSYIQLGDFDKAIPLIDKLAQLFAAQNNRFGLFEVKDAQIDILHSKGDINGLFHSAKSIIELVTSREENNLGVKRSRRSNTLVQAKEQEKTVKLLAKNNEVQRQEISLNKQLIDSKNRNIVLLSVFCLLLLALFIWLFYLLNKVHKLANTDSLTGINNRRSGLKKADLLLQKTRVNRDNTHMAFAMLDLDKFKQINDTYGHDVGDQVIKKTVKQALLSLDKNDIICRMGGEEFLIVLSNKSDDKITAQIEKIRKDINQAKIAQLGPSQKISASIGVAPVINTLKEKSLTDYLIDADTALYKAKNNGRNQVQIFDSVDA